MRSAKSESLMCDHGSVNSGNLNLGCFSIPLLEVYFHTQNSILLTTQIPCDSIKNQLLQGILVYSY